MRYACSTAPGRLKAGLFASTVMARAAGHAAPWFRGCRVIRMPHSKHRLCQVNLPTLPIASLST